MQYIFLIYLILLTLHVQAEEPKHTCNDPAVDQQWEEALAKYPNDHLILKLSVVRSGLCEMLNEEKLDLDTARFMWEQALTTALLERAREEQAKRGLLRLFGTF